MTTTCYMGLRIASCGRIVPRRNQSGFDFWRHVDFSFFFQAEDGIRDVAVTGVQTCALPISYGLGSRRQSGDGSDLQRLAWKSGSCKSQGGALCFADQGTWTGVISAPGLAGTQFTRVINMKRQWLGFSQARDSRPCSRFTRLCTAGRTGACFCLCLSFLAMYFLKVILSAAWTS